MIYICEYDDEADDRLLQERPGALLLQYTESDRTGIRWRKMRERILARLLLDYALKKEYGISFPELELYLSLIHILLSFLFLLGKRARQNYCGK